MIFHKSDEWKVTMQPLVLRETRSLWSNSVEGLVFLCWEHFMQVCLGSVHVTKQGRDKSSQVGSP